MISKQKTFYSKMLLFVSQKLLPKKEINISAILICYLIRMLKNARSNSNLKKNN